MAGNLRFVPAVLMLAGLTACGSVAAPQQAVGQSGSISVSLTTVQTIRSVVISPGHTTFVDCTGGDGGVDTRSKGDKLGFPNGTCRAEATIEILNDGIGSDIDISGANAVPNDGAAGWSLCNSGASPAVACTGAKHRPGPDQYKVINSGTFGTEHTGIGDTPRCDHSFGPRGSCWARHSYAFFEYLTLIGPQWSSDTSTNWTVTVTWTPVPGRQN
jgi:hypothetical protein